jgi:DNA oxidative demethylase
VSQVYPSTKQSTCKNKMDGITFYTYDGDIKIVIDEIDNELIVRPEIIVFGKKANQNRSVGFFSDTSIGYKYSGQIMKSKPLTPYIKNLLVEINQKFNSDFNGILVNRYTDGTDYIGAHSDDESGLGNNGVVAISYGATRKFRIRDKKTKTIMQDFPTVSNGIIHMTSQFNKEFTHEIPIEKKVKEVRYSFTFRKHII